MKDYNFANLVERDEFKRFLLRHDEHLVNILWFLENLEKLQDEARSWDSDKELEDNLTNIENRLTNEVGVRVATLYMHLRP